MHRSAEIELCDLLLEEANSHRNVGCGIGANLTLDCEVTVVACIRKCGEIYVKVYVARTERHFKVAVTHLKHCLVLLCFLVKLNVNLTLNSLLQHYAVLGVSVYNVLSEVLERFLGAVVAAHYQVCGVEVNSQTLSAETVKEGTENASLVTAGLNCEVSTYGIGIFSKLTASKAKDLKLCGICPM